MSDTLLETIERTKISELVHDSNYYLPDDTNPIDSWKSLKSNHVRDVGYVDTSLVTMRDGSRFIYRETIPDLIKYDVFVDFSPPLATRVNGFNSYMAEKIATAGIPNRLVGTDQTHHHSLVHAARATSRIYNEAETHRATCKPKESIIVGYSMGAMKAMGMLCIASEYDRKIRFNLGIDPCLAKPVTYLAHTPLEVATYFSKEGIQFGKVFLDNLINEKPSEFVKRTLQFNNTIALSPQFFGNVWDKWKMLATGEAGELAQKIPQDASTVLHFFNQSIFNDRQLFKQLMSNNSNIKIIEEDGYHLSCGNYQAIDKIVHKLVKCEQLLSEEVSNTELLESMSEPLLH